jgi:4-pyridoxolactonase
VRIYLLDLGSLVIDRSDVLWHIDVGTPVRFPVYGVYVDHPEGKFVFDTGFDLDHVNKVLPFELPEQTPEQTIPAQLARCGVKPEEIDFVINSHFHFDHVGGNKHLPNATLLTSKLELRSALVPEPFERLGYSDLTFYTRGTTKVEFLEGDTEVAEGLTLFETPGHTIAHYSLLAEPEGRRPMIFCGDACYTFETLERMIVGGFHLDPVDSISALKRIKAMAKEYDAEIFPSHEMGPWNEWKHAPDFYGA